MRDKYLYARLGKKRFLLEKLDQVNYFIASQTSNKSTRVRKPAQQQSHITTLHHHLDLTKSTNHLIQRITTTNKQNMFWYHCSQMEEEEEETCTYEHKNKQTNILTDGQSHTPNNTLIYKYDKLRYIHPTDHPENRGLKPIP